MHHGSDETVTIFIRFIPIIGAFVYSCARPADF
jgi:hypothetical protein